jgi:hypothetical protein
MKVLATIESVKITRKVQRHDGTFGNVYGVVITTGDDKIMAESFRTEESMKKAGIVPGAIGTVQLEFKVSEGISKAGNPYCIQNINLRSFELPKDLRKTTEVVPEQPATDKPQEVDLTQVPGQPVEGKINPQTGLPF